MAATIASNMIDTPTMDCLKHDAVLHLHAESAGSPNDSPSDTQTSLKHIPPPPNPPFVFPMRPSSSSSCAPPSFSRATGRRPRSAIEPHTIALGTATDFENLKSRSPALPNFSFNPGASLPSTFAPDATFLSPTPPPAAPGSPGNGPVRPGGHKHRRGGSEFVGGKIRDGEAITVTNISPTKSESGMASPMLQPTRPRQGHAHRRSRAISSHDLSSIILPPANYSVRGSSAPSSPALPDKPGAQDFPPVPKPAESDASPRRSLEAPTNPGDNAASAVEEPSQPAKLLTRNRVGFSDTLEYIPRPLSLVSSDASSTATARPGHSVSGSISSLISLTLTDRDLNSPIGFGSNSRVSDSRPSTAGAVLDRTQSSQEQDEAPQSPRRRGSIPFLGAVPPALPHSPNTPSPTRSGKKWVFFARDSHATGSPTRFQADGLSPSSTPITRRSSGEKSQDASALDSADVLSTTKPLTKKRSKKGKKAKTWAGTILSRKVKYRYGKQKRRTPTPPPIRFTEEVDDLDDGEMYMAPEPEPAVEPAVPIFTVTDPSGSGDKVAWTFPKHDSLPDEDTSYQMIDLDAALGPFNTPLPRNPEWEAAQKAGGHVKKQLHSAAGMSRFSGPGMHYHHRRAESAPEMVPFEYGRLGFRRFGSSSTMADVFEEDEEDDESSSSSVKSSTGQSTPVGEAQTTEELQPSAPISSATPSPEIAQENASAINAAPSLVESDSEESSERAKSVSDHSTDAPRDEAADVSIGPAPGTPKDIRYDQCYSESTTPSPRQICRPRDLAPVEIGPLNLPPCSLAPTSPFSMTQSSAFPSPRTPMSYDAHRISTAPSSITEDNFHSLLMGEPGPEVRISVDDIPSLTSSNSTMTRESLFAQYPQARSPPLNELPRPASFSSAAFGRRRSSLASLSRLISSSHGERSKLSVEVTLDSEPEKKAKVSKTKRISRMMQFWKHKDGETA
ncbi:hypothetical protein QBC42DRAFT_170185 [Cladorrhinum samala]|uniref:Cell wall proline rich protein n=1 Tax=Cladorrhinum samala TaxID=585594 RepID=A0AAV9HXP6_9PEZI|nr:hypothetical protein QBC42DRAFT_170185 [Cladorrhinum samala]